MYPDPNSNNRPVPPSRADIEGQPQEERLLPRAPPRMDKQDEDHSHKPHDADCSCNYNRYATKKTIGHGLLEFALLTSNAMQLRTLLLQKQRDGIWIASLALVSISIVAQTILAFILVFVGKNNIQNPRKQAKLELCNDISLFLTTLISMINVVINVFMSTTNANSFVDSSVLELMKNNT